MSATLVGRFEPGSPAWHAARVGRLGGSEIAAVVGLSPYESRFSLWHRKAGLIGEQSESVEMEWGKRLEPAIAAKFCEDHPELVPIIGGTFVNDDRPYQIASPDLRLGAPCSCPDDLIHEATCETVATSLLEVKTARFADDWGESGTDVVPLGYRCQVMWYLDTLGLRTAHVAVLFSGSDYREYVIPYDEADALRLRRAAVEFLASVRAGARPPLDGHNATYRVVREMHPEIVGETVELPVGVAVEYLIARQSQARAAERLQTWTATVADLMGSAKTATCNDYVIARRLAKGQDGTPYLVAGRNLPSPDELTSGEAA